MNTFFKRGWAAYCCAALYITGVAADQPQWGQRSSRNMVSAEKGLPDFFDPATGKNIKWKVQLGTETYATPVIGHGRVLLGTNNEHPRNPNHKGDLGVLLCLDEKDGRLIWQLVIPKREGDIFLDWPRTGMCSPATIDGDRVYMLNNRGVVMCLDLNGQANGNDGLRDEGQYMVHPGEAPAQVDATDADIIWAFDLTKDAGIHSHDGAHSSFLLQGDFLYLNTGNGVDNTHKKIRAPDAPSLVVLDKRTGRYLARDDEHIGPRIFHSTWSSPALGEVNGNPLIFLGGGDGVVYAFDALPSAPPAGQAATLKKVWQFDCDPAAPKENVHRFNGNRKESPSNIKSMVVFEQGRVYVTVGGDEWWGKTEAWLKCINASGAGDITATGQAWSYPLERHCMVTPAVADGMVFVGDSGRKFHCVDAASGQALWTHDLEGEMWSSPLVADGKVYIGTRGGDLWIFAASRGKNLINKITLDSPIHPTPVAANGVLYITTMQYLYAVQGAK